MRNPTWSRDELIVTLDFYFKHRSNIPGKSSKEIKELSQFLNILREKVGTKGDEKFRNTNGVYMKLMNFRRLDPNYSGKGLERGGKGDERVWGIFSTDLRKLTEISESISSFVYSDNPIPSQEIIEENDEEGEEGKVLTRIHRYRERDTKLVRRKKKKVFQELGFLSCECCSFDFREVYGQHGDGFIECHHNKPVSKLKVGEKTKLSELSLLCSNCHRMIHKRKPWLSIDDLKKILQINEGKSVNS